jgi:hypothetical protein
VVGGTADKFNHHLFELTRPGRLSDTTSFDPPQADTGDACRRVISDRMSANIHRDLGHLKGHDPLLDGLVRPLDLFMRSLDMFPQRSDQVALFVRLSEQFYDAVAQMRDFGDRGASSPARNRRERAQCRKTASSRCSFPARWSVS